MESSKAPETESRNGWDYIAREVSLVVRVGQEGKMIGAYGQWRMVDDPELTAEG